MNPILRKVASVQVWVAAILTVVVMFFALYGGVEGVAAPDGSRGVGAAANQSAGDTVVHGPSTLSVHENTAIGTSIAFYRVVTSTGADVSGEVYSFSLEGEDAGKYRIDSRSGELFTAAWLDYETDVSDTFLVYASSDTAGVGLDVTVSIVNLEDSVSTLSVSKANPVPGVGRGNPEHALDAPEPENFVETEYANWGTILRIVARRESPDPDCGTGLDCIFISVASREAGDEQQLMARRSGESGFEYVAAVMLKEGESDVGQTVEIEGADGEIRQAYLLAVGDEDEVWFSFDNLRSSADVENEPPEFGEVAFEQELAFGSVDVEFNFEVTDVGSWLPEPEDLPDNDGDHSYTPVAGLVHDGQCFSSASAGESLEAVGGISLNGGSIYCDGEPEIYPIRDDRDFDEIDRGYSVRTTLVLEQASTYFVSFIACDNAGNCAVYDADEDSDALLLRVDTLGEEPADPCITTITWDAIAGAAIIEGEWDGSCPSGRAPEPYGGDGDRYARYYTFSLDSTSDVTITLTSEEDTYLYLLKGAGKDGAELHENDDVVPSEDLNSRIKANLGPGQYTIEATTYYSQKTGEFTLEVSGIGGAAPEDGDCSSGIAVNDPEENAGLVSDCEALLAARDKLAGTASLNWSADLPMEQWHGVLVGGEPMRVLQLGFYEHGLTGIIPPELGELDGLEELSLTSNELGGEIPPELARLDNLRSLWLEDNRLTGAIPPELGELDLKGLFLSHNRLTGSIPAELSHITYLVYLELDGNQLTGQIPQEFANFTGLFSLRLAGNQLTGCIPDRLRDVQENDFDELGLSFCGDTIGPTPTPTLPANTCVSSLGDFESRVEVIDDHWDDWCESANRPDAADTYARFFTFNLTVEADVTITLESDEDAYLYLLEGEGEWGEILYEDDDTDGTNPRIWTTLQPGSYTVEATTYEIDVTGDFRISVESDALDGRPPVTCITEMDRVHSHSSYIYPIFIDGDCKSVSRPNDDDYYARYFSLPLKFPAEVAVTLTSKEDAYLFLLKGEGVTGAVLYENDDENAAAEGTNSRIEATLRPGIYTIEATTYGESISGEFELVVSVDSTSRELCSNGRAVSDPDNNIALLGDCSTLLDLKYSLTAEPPLNWSADLPMEEWEGVTLGGESIRVTELHLFERGLSGEVSGDFDRLAGVQTLFLTGNRLTGTMPWPWNQESLEFLEIGSNRFGGAMHRPWGGFTSLGVLNAYDNKLSGEIPREIGDLPNLYGLLLHQNRLDGEIPHTLGKLRRLEKMSLSHNRLVGEIPPELTELTNLHGLYLSGNYLTGCIPHELRDVRENDFDELGLPFCLPPFTDDCVEPLPAVSAITIQDTWEDGCSSDSGDLIARYYTLSLDAPTLVGLGLSTGHGGYLLVREGEGIDGRVIEEEEDFEDIVYSVSMLPPGNYTIEVADDSWNEDGDFSLMVRLMEDVAPRQENDVSALMALYLATDGHGWDVSDNWLTQRPLSEWHGVMTDSLGRVTALRVGGNNLRYGLPPELGLLSELRVLHLEFNELVGEIPRELGKLRYLRELRLSFNDLTGPIPAQLGDLSNLVELHLNDNDIAGDVPPELGKLRELELFGLGQNELSGQIPAELGRLTKVRVFSIQTNHLTGHIPAELGSLTELTRLSLSHNELSGEIPPELSNLRQVEILTLRSNFLSGTIPPELGNLRSLKVLELTNNRLTGEIPSELSNLEQLEHLRLGENFLGGSIPSELGDLRSLNVLELTNNGLTGEIPRELGKLANLERLALGGCNGLSGQIPWELGDLKKLRELYLYTNNLVGEIPKELAGLQELRDLRLYRNNLTGEIPSELGEIAGLEHLILSFNELEGEIPSELGNIHELRELDLEENLLTGEIPKSLAKLQRLEYSDFRRNDLTGCIPYGMKGFVETDPVLPVCPAP